MAGSQVTKTELVQMAKMSANGATTRDIGAAVGRNHATVARNLQSAEAKAIIERESARLLDALPDITQSSLSQIETSNKIHMAIAGHGEIPGTFKDTAEALQYAGIAAKRETDILKAVGILASPVQSIVVQQIYNDNRKASLTPDLLKALSGVANYDDEPEEAEIIGGDNA